MSDNVLETVRATVQDFLAPEIRTHGVRLENIERRLDDTRHSLEHRSDDLKNSLEHRIEDMKEVLRAEMHTVDSRVVSLDSRFTSLEARFTSLESLVRNFMQQVSADTSLRERVASLEARMPKQ